MKDNKEQQIKALRLYINSLGVTPAELYSVEQVEGSSRNWEIIEFLRPMDSAKFILGDDGIYRHNWRGNGITLSDMLHDGCCVDSGHWLIHSVRRKSDGVVFTIGDKVCWGYEKWEALNEIIEKFEVKNDKLDAKMQSGFCYTNVCGESEYVGLVKHYTEPIPEKPKVILTTTDGVEITDPKQFVYDVSIDWQRSSSVALTRTAFSGYAKAKWPYVFSTKEAAQKFIMENKPLFSINDLLKLERDGGSSNCGGEIYVNTNLLNKEAAKRINS